MSSRRIVRYVLICRNTTHPTVHAKLILNFQTCLQNGLAIHTGGLAGDQGVTDSIIVSVNQQVELLLNIFATSGKSKRLQRTQVQKMQSFLMLH